MELDSYQRAIERATYLFWEKGAETASYTDIVAATGVSRKVLYAQWSDKEALIADTLNIYYEIGLRPLVALLNGGGIDGIVKFWDSFEATAQTGKWPGCYLLRTASGPLRAKDFVSELYIQYITELALAFETQVANGQSTGQIDGSLNSKNAGWQIVGLMHLISAVAAQNGYDARVKNLFRVARETCGLSR